MKSLAQPNECVASKYPKKGAKSSNSCRKEPNVLDLDDYFCNTTRARGASARPGAEVIKLFWSKIYSTPKIDLIFLSKLLRSVKSSPEKFYEIGS